MPILLDLMCLVNAEVCRQMLVILTRSATIDGQTDIGDRVCDDTKDLHNCKNVSIQHSYLNILVELFIRYILIKNNAQIIN